MSHTFLCILGLQKTGLPFFGQLKMRKINRFRGGIWIFFKVLQQFFKSHLKRFQKKF